MLRPPSFSLADSVLLRRCVDDDGFDWDMIDHGQHRPGEFDAELSELHAVEADVASAITEAEAAEVLLEHPEYPEWSSRCLWVRGVTPTLDRQAAVIIVRQAIGRARVALRQSCLDPPRPGDRLYLAYPVVFNRLTPDDRLLPLTADAFDGIDPHRDGDLLLANGDLLALDPWLCDSPELLNALRTATSTAGLRVSVAVDRHRLPVRNESRWQRLREEQLWGVPLTLENVDSLDRKDQSTSFHAAMDRHVLLEHSDPVLGTWISARAEPPRRIFYVQESLPADHDAYVHGGRLRIRALHAERETTRRRFTHVDGKLELYPVAEWCPSRQSPTTPLPAPTGRRKLWRVDAPNGMPDRMWAELVSGFFRRNELVAEHFATLGTEPLNA